MMNSNVNETTCLLKKENSARGNLDTPLSSSSSSSSLCFETKIHIDSKSSGSGKSDNTHGNDVGARKKNVFLKPPLPLGGGSYGSIGSRYGTCNMGSCMLGLSMENARKKLLSTIEYKIEEKERSGNFTKEFRDPFSLLLVLCAFFRFVDYGRIDNDFQYELFEGFFLLGAAIINILLNATQRRRHHKEIAERIRFAVEEMRSRHVITNQNERYLLSPERMSNRTTLLPSTCLIACYRDHQWQRIPMNLLVENDIIGLMSGDIAPGKVRLIQDQSALSPVTATLSMDTSTNSHRTSEKFIFERGSKIPSCGNSKETTRCKATFDPSLVLSLCGEMRIFEMLETPVLQDIDDVLFCINRPETFTQKLQAKARYVAIYVCTMYSVLILLAIGLRVILQHRSLYTTLNHVLLGPIGIWLCFASLNTPFVLFIAEAAATASILGHFEEIIMPFTKSNTSFPFNSQKKTLYTKEKTQFCTTNEKEPLLKGQELLLLLQEEEEEEEEEKQQQKQQDQEELEKEEVELSSSDMYDFEDREKMRSKKKASKQSVMFSITRVLKYFYVTLKFRLMSCKRAHATTGSMNCLPIPFRSFRLLERLGSTTMLCCFDDEILCEQSPSVEEIFLLNEKQGSSTILDLHPDTCRTGLKFEDPKWKQHLSSLKPIGLAIMLNDTEYPFIRYQNTLRYLQSETNCMLHNPTAMEEIRDPNLRTCLLRLSAHVRMLPFPKHLLNLSKEIGFVNEDLSCFQRQQSVHIICPRLAYLEHTTDHHDQGQEDTKYRGNLKTHVYSTIVLDKRSNRHQLLTRGHPALAVTQCSEYWDGKSICPLTAEKRKQILEMYNQWRVEDLDCVAFSYAPVPHRLNGLFTVSREHGQNTGHHHHTNTGTSNSSTSINTASGTTSVVPSSINSIETTTGTGRRNSSPSLLTVGPFIEMLPPVYLVEDSTAGEMTTTKTTDTTLEPLEMSSFGGDEEKMSQKTLSPTAISSPKRGGIIGGGDITSSIGGGTANGGNGGGGGGSGAFLAEMSTTDKDALLWKIQEDQIFVGMVATGVQPKKNIPDFIEDLTASGIRFVYFSPRNMRRSKLLAEKMGIETDWNCAISLRPLDCDGPDPHRMTSNYSDWDVKARLPHGVEAIKRHLKQVDNVPLLVSLYTDSTPETISEMISIFQENHEVVMGVGNSLKESNAHLFSKADSAIALQSSCSTFFDGILPKKKKISCFFSEEDLQLSHILNTLACSFRIKSELEQQQQQQQQDEKEEHNDHTSNNIATATGNVTSNGNGNGSGGTGTQNLTNVIELIRLGRKGLTNFHQMMTFIFVSQMFLASFILASFIVPFSFVPQLSCGSIFWLLWVLVPALSLSMLFSPSDKEIMKRTPRKNEEITIQDDLPRLAGYFILRHFPSVLVCILVFECLMGFSLEDSSRDGSLGQDFLEFSWVDFILHNEIVFAHPRPPVVVAAMSRAESGMLLMIGMIIIASSCGYLYRAESIFTESPLRNYFWVGTACGLLVLQLILSMVWAGIHGADGKSLWYFVQEAVPWYFWLIYLIWPILILIMDEIIKLHDRKHLIRYFKFLRMQFDTRLGMWSPK